VKLGFGTGLRQRKRIIIFGTPLAQPTAFNINIGEPGKLLVTANVLFHLSPDFLKNKVKEILRIVKIRKFIFRLYATHGL